MSKLTLDDLIYLAKDDPLASKTGIEEYINEQIKSASYKSYREGVELRETLKPYFTGFAVTVFAFCVLFGGWKIHDNRSKEHETLLASELESCKSGKTADCLAAIGRANEERDTMRQELYAKVYFETTNKSLPGMSNITEGFSDIKYDASGNLVIDLSTAKTLVIKPAGRSE